MYVQSFRSEIFNKKTNSKLFYFECPIKIDGIASHLQRMQQRFVPKFIRFTDSGINYANFC